MIAQRLVVEQILADRADRRADIRAGRRNRPKKRASEPRSRHQRWRWAATAEDASAIDAAAQFGTAQVDYIYEQPPEELFRALLPKYVAIQIFRAMLESVAAEHAARMTAMDSATNNATEMIDSLTLVHEPRPSGQDHQGNYRDRQRRSGNVKKL